MNKLNKSLEEISSSRKFLKSHLHFIRGLHNGNIRLGLGRRTLNKKLKNKRRIGRLNKFNHSSQRDNRRRLFVTNLNKKLTNNELKTLFVKFGKLRRCGINFTLLGESKGNADVEYERHRDAVYAIKHLNNTNINGRVINIRFFNLKRINHVRNRLRFRNRNLNLVNRRKNKLQNRKKRVFKKSLGKKRQ